MTQEIVKQNSLFAQLAQKYNITEKVLLETLKNTIMKPDKTGRVATDAEIVAFLLVASKYDLNPFTKEIYAFPDKRAGIVPIVGIDGFITLANRQIDFDGYDISWSENIVTNDGAKPCPEWCEVKLYRKDRKYPTIVREYLDEVYVAPRGEIKLPGPWQTHTKRMLRHKTLIQGFRVAFGFVGIYDEDEAERIIETKEVSAKPIVQMPRAITQEPSPPATDIEQQEEEPSVGPIEHTKTEVLETLAITAFKKNKKYWLNFLGAEYGVEKSSELTDEQSKDCLKKLQDIIRNDKA